jgi:hypothetical protein
MLKRTNGIMLLLLLVLTGLAGRITSNTITSKERHILVDHLKETRNFLLKNVKGLSEEQFNFKPSADKWSIKECLQHIALSEGGIRQMAEGTIAQTANPGKRSEIKVSDQQLIEMVTDRSHKAQAAETLKPETAQWKTADQALTAFKDKRAELLKYAKTTTADMRSHVTQGPMGAIDAYQVFLLLSAHTKRHTLQIIEVKNDPKFPK